MTDDEKKALLEMQKQTNELHKVNAEMQKKLETLTNENTALNENLKKKNSEVGELHTAQKSTEVSSFIGGLVTQGKLAPGLKTGLEAFMMSLSAEPKTVVYKADEKSEENSQFEFFKKWIEGFGKIIQTGETATKENAGSGEEGSGAAATLHGKVMAYAKENGIESLAEAYDAYVEKHGESGK